MRIRIFWKGDLVITPNEFWILRHFSKKQKYVIFWPWGTSFPKNHVRSFGWEGGEWQIWSSGSKRKLKAGLVLSLGALLTAEALFLNSQHNKIRLPPNLFQLGEQKPTNEGRFSLERSCKLWNAELFFDHDFCLVVRVKPSSSSWWLSNLRET